MMEARLDWRAGVPCGWKLYLRYPEERLDCICHPEKKTKSVSVSVAQSRSQKFSMNSEILMTYE